ncbi:MAG: hypothetical protein ACHQIM_00185 [Sphingobacteriales bacterium]
MKLTGIFTHFKRQTSLAGRSTFRIRHAYLLNGILSLMTRSPKPFPIPIRAKGMEIFKKYETNGTVLCSLHLPLTKVALRYLIENGFKPTAAITGDQHLKNSMAVWGINDRIPALQTGPFVLNRAKSILRQGGTVVALADQKLGGKISPNIFLLAQMLNARVVYFFSELRPDGTIDVSFFESDIAGLRAENAVGSQIMELQNYVTGILGRYGNTKLLYPASK